jgi:hypothetical protein
MRRNKTVFCIILVRSMVISEGASGTGIQRVSINDTGDGNERNEQDCCENSVHGDAA